MRKRKKRIMVVCIITLLAIIAFYLIENIRGSRAWESEKARLIAAGESVLLSRLVPEMPDDDANFAMIPLLRPLNEYSRKEDGEVVWGDQEAYEKAMAGWDFISLLPPIGKWWTGRQIELDEWRSEFQRRADDQADLSTQALFIEIAKLIDSKSSDLEAVRVALNLPCSVFPLHYADLEEMMLSHLSVIRRMGQLFLYRSLLQILDDANPASVGDILSSLGSAMTIDSDRILISALVQRANLEYSITVVKEGLWRRKWSKGSLVQLEKELEGIDMLSRLQIALKAERTFGVEIIEKIRESRQLSRVLAPEGDSAYKKLVDLLAFLAPRGWFDQNKASYSKFLDSEVISLIHSEERVVDCSQLPLASKRILRRTQTNPIYGFSFGTLLSSITIVVEKFTVAQTGLDLARIACALERYWMTEGEYPLEMDALVPSYMESIPHDVMTGEPLKYRRDGERFVLYSVGLNEVDDGGEIALVESSGSIDYERGDLVWRYPEE